jgi:hypothetical protein
MAFNMDAFLNTPVDEPTSTRITICPEGEYRAIIDDVSESGINSWVRPPIDTKRGPMTILQVPWVILDEDVKKTVGRDKVVVNMDIILDVDTITGQLIKGDGKNVSLGRLRSALGQNDAPGWTFTKLPGAGPALVKVTHRPDRNDPEIKYPEIRRVTRIG